MKSMQLLKNWTSSKKPQTPIMISAEMIRRLYRSLNNSKGYSAVTLYRCKVGEYEFSDDTGMVQRL
jgi:hypothetical protein